MTSRKTLKIIVPTSDITYDDLANIEKTEERNQEKPKSLPLGDIHIADKAFQWRLENDNLLADQSHIKELARVLRSLRKPLTAITVTAIGSKFYALDGHHRLAAYHSVGWTKRVPVNVFPGNLRAAWVEALKKNIHDKLPMTTEAKYEAAWKLNQVKTANGDYAYSKMLIHEMTTASDGLIGEQRRVLAKHGQDVVGRTWKQARSLEWDQSNREANGDWKEEKAREIANEILASVGTNLTSNPDIAARALEMISPELPESLVWEWLDTARRVVKEHHEYEENERRLVAEGKSLDI